jgi:hypothetical protein
MQLQPGLRRGDLATASADDQPGHNHRGDPGHAGRLTEQVGRIRSKQRGDGFQHWVGDPAANRDGARRHHGTGEHAAASQDCEAQCGVQYGR